jgi:excisionase family DNA binding protein
MSTMQSNVVPDSSAPLLTPRQAAEMLAVCERTLWDLTHRKKEIPCVRIGRAVRYDEADLRAWIGRHKTGGVQ